MMMSVLNRNKFEAYILIKTSYNWSMI